MAYKPTVAVVTSEMDRRGAKGTAIAIRKLVEGLLLWRDRLDITLVHRCAIPEDPLYQAFTECIIPQVSTPRFSRIISDVRFFLTEKKRFDVWHYAHPKVYPTFFLAPAKRIAITLCDGGAITAGKDLTMVRDKLNAFEWWLVKRFCDASIAVSHFGARGLIETRGLRADRVHTVYNGVDGDLFFPRDKKMSQADIRQRFGIVSPFLMASGRLDPHKNIDRLIQAYALLVRQHALPHPLVIAGGEHMPEYTKQVRDRIKHEGLEHRVHILRIPDDADMPLFYSAAEMLIFPSLYEGFGLPLVEAMRCGTPVVASQGSSLSEVGGDACVYFDPRDPQDMASAIYRLLQDDALQQTCVRRGYIQSQPFTWKAHADAMAQLYLTLAGQT